MVQAKSRNRPHFSQKPLTDATAVLIKMGPAVVENNEATHACMYLSNQFFERNSSSFFRENINREGTTCVLHVVMVLENTPSDWAAKLPGREQETTNDQRQHNRATTKKIHYFCRAG